MQHSVLPRAGLLLVRREGKSEYTGNSPRNLNSVCSHSLTPAKPRAPQFPQGAHSLGQRGASPQAVRDRQLGFSSEAFLNTNAEVSVLRKSVNFKDLNMYSFLNNKKGIS